MYASLVNPATMEEIQDPEGEKYCTGSLCSSLYRLKDLDGYYGGFFVFPDLMVSKEGEFRLKFTLYEVCGWVFLLLLHNFCCVN